MAYNASYTFSDMAAITGNLIGKTGIEAKDYTSLFVLLGAVMLGVAIVTMSFRR